MQFTGERYLPELKDAQISYEHWHRYLYASQFVADKTVLDVACGEGYGAHLLSLTALKVIGVDIDRATILHDSSTYTRENLEFRNGPADDLPDEWENLFDVVVSFETIEHLSRDAQRKFLLEVERVLRPDGVFIASTPNRLTYSDLPDYTNPFHVDELYLQEFDELLAGSFEHRVFLGQKVFPVSYLWNLREDARVLSEYTIAQSEAGFRPTTDPKTFIYTISLCSKRPIDGSPASLLVDLSERLIAERDAVAVQRLHERDATIDSLRREFAGIEAGLTAEQLRTSQDLSAQVFERDRTIKDLRSRARALEQALEVHTVRHSEQTESINQLEEEIAQLKTELSSFVSRVAQQSQTVSRLESDLEERSRLARQLEGRVLDKERLIREIESEKEEREHILQSEISRREDDLQEAQRALDDLNRQLAEREHIVQESQRGLDDLNRRIKAEDELSKREIALRAQLAQLERQAAEHRGRMDSLEQERAMWHDFWRQLQQTRAWRLAIGFRRLRYALTGKRMPAPGPVLDPQSIEATVQTAPPSARTEVPTQAEVSTPSVRPSGMRLGLRRLRTQLPGNSFLLRLDEPSGSGPWTNSLVVRGWALSTHSTVERVEAWLGTAGPSLLTCGLPRGDVATIFSHPSAAHSGFQGRVNLEKIAAGSHELVVRAMDANGGTRETRMQILVNAPSSEPILHVDEPATGVVTHGRLTFAGWVESQDAEIVRVEALVDGQPLGPIPVRQLGPDDPRAGESVGRIWAFNGEGVYESKQQSTRTVLIRAIDAMGRQIEKEVEVRFAVAERVRSEVETIQWAGHTLDIEGWAFWAVEKAPRRVRVTANGTLLGDVKVGLARPDIAARYSDDVTALRSGFHFRAHLPPTDEQEEMALTLAFLDDGQVRAEKTLYVEHVASEAGDKGDEIDGVLGALLHEVRTRTDRDPSVLNWDSHLDLSPLSREVAIVSPPENGGKLPYLDETFDVVVMGRRDPTRLDEARRVARTLVVSAEQDEQVDNEAGHVKLVPEWRTLDAAPLLPSTSIVIPVHNNLSFTDACLDQLALTLPTDLDVEVIVVDDASTDDTPDVLARRVVEDSRLRVIRNEESLGFLLSSNRGASEARGDVIVFLNNDTLPQPNWLLPLLQTLSGQPEAGAVGGKLIYPDGSLQEAGGVIFSDGSGFNFGKHDPDPDAALYSYVREVDYCSGALLATWRRLFEENGGFDPHFAPAYYEDTDYCFSLRAKGYRVYYQPDSVVIHFEGASSGTDLTSGVKRYQAVNQSKFIEKWTDALKRQPEPPDSITPRLLHRWAVREERGVSV